MGRAPTSGYCQTCRRRRVKCDRGVPSCQRCLKSGHSCGGYETPLRMVNYSVARGQQSALQRAPSSSRSSWMHGTPSLSYASELSLVAFDGQISLDYFLASYTWAHWWKSIVITGLQGDTASASYIACRSLLMGHLGVGNSDAKLQQRSMQLYGQSMRLVSSSLDMHQSSVLADLILPVMILSMYPYVMEKSVKLEHDLGLGLITRNCGPDCSQDDRTVSIFRSCRSMLICTALAKRCRTFLEEDVWKSAPFRASHKTCMDRLYDITSSLPGLAEEVLGGRNRQPEQVVDAVAKAETLYRELRAWRYDWERINPGAATVLTVSDSSKAASSVLVRQLLGRQIRFNSLGQALEIFNYNAALVYLSRLQELLRSRTSASMHIDVAHIESQLRDRQTSSPLLLTNELELPCLPALEAVQQCAYLATELKPSVATNFIALAPVGILYCALKSMGPLGELLSLAVADIFSATPALDQLEVFGIWDTPDTKEATAS
ncbi:Zn(2)-C6 fungal-type domain-containing protein [Fusarium keratoplasticum]|uniref:Zn(2)-C6 fungal-type domain-containing protein n=1 Tax=Fusarium keratoplasticum TaxID=1328300 RepID=A0ACC0QW99_9HYPO|nr:Zn(2)-C6 fungal-type domain-containing protein [Fusarium keratoplasticum]KAI8668660.1 Zn(2)-C6 fungal-type domain-containing protein [Fusarium keratoplasticum]